MDSLNSNSDAIIAIATAMQVIITCALVGITFYYAKVTKKTLEENQRMRLEAQKPEIAIYAQFIKESLRHPDHPKKDLCVYLNVKNIGVGHAANIKCTTDLSFSLPSNRSLDVVPFLRKEIPYLSPGHKRTFRLAEERQSGFSELIQKEIKIMVTYTDSAQQDYEECFGSIDFQEYKNE